MIDFISIFEENRIEYELSSGWINIQCPFCDDHSKHLGINIEGGYAHCFRCGGHHIESVISKKLHITKFQAKNIIDRFSDRYILTKVISKIPERKISEVILPGEELLKRHRQYLIKRKFDPDFLIRKYKILGTGMVGYWCWRIIIPIFFQDKLVAYQGRDITGKASQKYLTSSLSESLYNPKHILYNLDNCKKDSVVLVEGVFDCWRFGDDSASTLGTAMTEEQIKLLVRRFKTVYFLFDPEKEAQKRASNYGEKLSSYGKEVFIIDTELDKDPGDMSEKDIMRLRRSLHL